MVKNPLANAGDVGTQVQSPGREDPLEKRMATHSSTLAWRTPWMEEPGGLWPMGRKESDMTEATQHALYNYNIISYIDLHPKQ